MVTCGEAMGLLMCLAGAVGPASTAARAAPEGKDRVAVVVGAAAPEPEHFAARELCGYLHKLFGLSVAPVANAPEDADLLLLVGSASSSPLIEHSSDRGLLSDLTDQGIALVHSRHEGRPALLIGGGSPRATLWAVYELVERWGVQFLLHGDVLPPPRGFSLPAEDVVLEPRLPVRQWRVVNDFAMGPESWGIEHYRPILRQLAKMKYNRIFVSIWPYQPFLDLQYGGIRRRQAWLWYGDRYPITADMVGRELFGDEPELWNPDLPFGASYEQLAAAGQGHIRAIMQQAKSLGMEVAISASVLEFPAEFAPLLPGSQKVHQLGEMWIVPGPETAFDDATVTGLAAAVLRTTVDSYPDTDRIALGMPEFRQWSASYERAWQELDAKYGIEQIAPLSEVLAAARAREDYPGGPDRALQEVQGDIVALRFIDRLLTEVKPLQGSARPDVRFSLSSVAEELFPVLARIAPPETETVSIVDYTPSRVLNRRAALGRIPAREVPSILISTLHDDNVGVLPQLTTGSHHELLSDLKRHGWAGFSTRYWLLGDHDASVSYLAQTAWRDDVTPEDVYRRQVAALCGEDCVPDMLRCFAEVETTTVQLEWHGLGLTFTVPGMMMKHWGPGELPADLSADRESYRRALAAAEGARPKAAGGLEYVDYWIGRLRFGIGYIDTIELVRKAATAEGTGQTEEALKLARQALETVRQALAAYAEVARDRSDVGAIAVMNQFVVREMQAKVDQLAEGGGR